MDDADELQAPLPGGDRALAIVLEWLGALSDDCGGRALRDGLTSGSASATSPASRMRAAGLQDWAETLVLEVVEGGEGSLIAGAGRDLFRRAGVELAVSPRHPRTFDHVDALWDLAQAWTERPLEAVVARLRGSDEDHGFLTILADRLSRAVLWDCRGQSLAEDRAESELQSRDLWPGAHEPLIWDHWPCHVAARVWPADFIRVVESLPIPYRHAAIGASAPLSMDETLALIDATPDVFDGSGRPSGPAAIFALLASLLDPSRPSDGGLIAPEPDDIDLAKLMDVVTGRSDGTWLGRAWLQQLIWSAAGTRWSRYHAERLKPVADSLLDGLSIRLAGPLEDPWTWIEKEQDLWRADRLLAEAACIAVADSEAAAILLAEGVVRGLVTPTNRLDALDHKSLEFDIVGDVLTHHPDPAAWFRSLWTDTYDRRERAAHQWPNVRDQWSFPALAWGLRGVNLPITGKPLWDVVFFALQDVLLTGSEDHDRSDDWRIFLIEAGALCAVRTTTGTLPISDLAAFIKLIAVPDERFVNVMGSMLTDATASTIVQACNPDSCRIAGFLAAGLERSADHPVQSRRIPPEQRARVELLIEGLKSDAEDAI